MHIKKIIKALALANFIILVSLYIVIGDTWIPVAVTATGLLLASPNGGAPVGAHADSTKLHTDSLSINSLPPTASLIKPYQKPVNQDSINRAAIAHRMLLHSSKTGILVTTDRIASIDTLRHHPKKKLKRKHRP